MRYLMLMALLSTACSNAREGQIKYGDMYLRFENTDHARYLDFEQLEDLMSITAEAMWNYAGFSPGETYNHLLTSDIYFVSAKFPCPKGTTGEGRDCSGLYRWTQDRITVVFEPEGCFGASSLAHEWLHRELHLRGENRDRTHELTWLWEDMIREIKQEFGEMHCDYIPITDVTIVP